MVTKRNLEEFRNLTRGGGYTYKVMNFLLKRFFSITQPKPKQVKNQPSERETQTFFVKNLVEATDNVKKDGRSLSCIIGRICV